MVNPKHLLTEFRSRFKWTGNSSVDEAGLISCTGNVTFKIGGDRDHFPVKFHKVLGNFDCAVGDLLSLEGAPTYVGGNFSCQMNRLNSLKGGPQHVEGSFDCSGNPILDLTGVPQFVGGRLSLDYSPEQNLLRLCSLNDVYWASTYKHIPSKVHTIMTKYAGTGKPGAIKAAGELIKAGYKQNARW
jgi:hypothetical protein